MVVYKSEEVAIILHTFFTKLYSLPIALPTNPHDRHRILQDFLSSCNFPKLLMEAFDSLNAPIMSEEVGEVLKLLPSGNLL